MKAAPFAFARASDLAHVFALWKEAGADARLLAGGQSLLPGLSLRLADTPALIDINQVPELLGVTELGDRLAIGALTRMSQLLRDPLVAAYAPAIAQAVPLIAHPSIRNRGTIGGSIAYADPAAELPACAVALEAQIVVRSEQGERRIPAEEFFLGLYETALEPFEMVVSIEIPKPAQSRRQVVLELARRSGDYAIAGIVAAADVADERLSRSRVVYFGVGNRPDLAHGAMAALDDGDLDAAEAALQSDLDPPGDLQGGPQTKRHLARVLLCRAVAALRAQTPGA